MGKRCIKSQEIASFNKTVNSNDLEAVKLAVTGLKARHDAVNGTNPKLISGKVQYYDNPRIENENNNLKSTNKKLLKLGLKSIYINEIEINKIEDEIRPFLSHVKKDLICPKTTW